MPTTIPEVDDELIAQPTLVVKLSAATHALTGLFVGLSGAQLLGARFVAEWRNLLPYVMIAIGLSLLFTATQTHRVRGWAAAGAPAVAGLALLATIGWFVHILSAGGLSCLSLLTPPLAVLDLVLALLAIGPAGRAAAARRRLSDQGLDLGL